MKVTLIAHTPNPLYVCAQAASVCYHSEPSLKIVKGCIRSGHASILEHATFTFKIEGISRACSHQIVRHRIASYSQESQRYVTYDNLEWALDGLDELNKDTIEADCDYALLNYRQLIDKGVPAEQARAVLPNATPTTIYMTMNFRSLMHFCNERLCTRAQAEIRQVAKLMKNSILEAEDISIEEKQIIGDNLVPKCEMNSIKSCPEMKGCGRHPSLKGILDKARAQWVAIEGEGYYECSNCHVKKGGVSQFCPCCGAYMSDDQNG